MEGGYLSPVGGVVTEKVIEKSRFITVSRHICGDEEAKAFINEVCARHPLATHNCYAYIADRAGNVLRFSDNGEPSGTAGMPMLEVLRSKNLKEVAVVVTRYFGGIKLGAGGLVRAYSGCVSENLAKADIVSYLPCRRLSLSVAYADADISSRIFVSFGARVLSAEYADGVRYEVAVEEIAADNFIKALSDAVGGRMKAEDSGRFFCPSPTK